MDYGLRFSCLVYVLGASYVDIRSWSFSEHFLVISFHCDICGADLEICDVVSLSPIGLAVLSIEPHSGLIDT